MWQEEKNITSSKFLNVVLGFTGCAVLKRILKNMCFFQTNGEFHISILLYNSIVHSTRNNSYEVSKINEMSFKYKFSGDYFFTVLMDAL